MAIIIDDNHSKILFVDISLSGHHLSYLQALTNKKNCVLLLPEKCKSIHCIQYITKFNVKRKSLLSYIIWLKEIKKIAQQEDIDIIHLLYGDMLLKYFGFCLFFLKPKKIVITFHHIRKSKIRRLSIKRLFKKIDYGVIHTKSLANDLTDYGISNFKHIEYPSFHSVELSNQKLLRKKLNIPIEHKVLLAIGGTRFDKGLDILLNSLKYVNETYTLIIAGKEEDFSKDFILNEVASFKNKVMCFLYFLNDNEFSDFIASCDILVLPYRKIFNGASGPLGAAVCQKKYIIGPSHDSLGEIIMNNHLGSVFEAENAESLASTIKSALNSDLIIDEKYTAYYHSLNVNNFKGEYNKLYAELHRGFTNDNK